ncbi:MAG: hypothetical protein JST64_10660, partial [Actinobacteria bacterium]|nr:hypothetical protein [Actinomycetota bacterium]
MKRAAVPTTWKVRARIDGDTLTATATSRLKMSDLGVGPISKAGLVSTGDDITVTLRLTARDGSSYRPPSMLATSRPARPTTTSGPSFSREVAPILEQSC